MALSIAFLLFIVLLWIARSKRPQRPKRSIGGIVAQHVSVQPEIKDIRPTASTNALGYPAVNQQATVGQPAVRVKDVATAATTKPMTPPPARTAYEPSVQLIVRESVLIVGGEDVLQLSAKEFELRVIDWLKAMGRFAEVRYVGGSQERGADIVARCEPSAAMLVFQVKHYLKSSLSIDAVKQAVWAKQSYDAAAAFVVTTAAEIPSFVELEARRVSVSIIRRREVISWCSGKVPDCLRSIK